MIKLSEKNRKVLRAIYKGLGVTAVSFVFGACPVHNNPDPGWAAYGMPPDYEREQLHITGTVRAKDNNYKPIKGIAVVADGVNNYYPYTTDGFGNFYIWVSKQEKESYTLIFSDIDGERNGGKFKSLEITLTIEEIQALEEEPLLIDLELEAESE